MSPITGALLCEFIQDLLIPLSPEGGVVVIGLNCGNILEQLLAGTPGFLRHSLLVSETGGAEAAVDIVGLNQVVSESTTSITASASVRESARRNSPRKLRVRVHAIAISVLPLRHWRR